MGEIDDNKKLHNSVARDPQPGIMGQGHGKEREVQRSVHLGIL